MADQIHAELLALQSETSQKIRDFKTRQFQLVLWHSAISAFLITEIMIMDSFWAQAYLLGSFWVVVLIAYLILHKIQDEREILRKVRNEFSDTFRAIKNPATVTKLDFGDISALLGQIFYIILLAAFTYSEICP
ncbi:MAG TPA: hypothetical protein PKW15_07235 [Alphaproteobacteria bacterium]|nr:hypothetical protein [Rhodospirillaceae bacterium]HRJ13018.1 hypothetical protein [Alphaproteobacteria bacterium]